MSAMAMFQQLSVRETGSRAAPGVYATEPLQWRGCLLDPGPGPTSSRRTAGGSQYNYQWLIRTAAEQFIRTGRGALNARNLQTWIEV